MKLPWFVCIQPGEAETDKEAVAFACAECDAANDGQDPIDPETVSVSVCEPDFKALAREHLSTGDPTKLRAALALVG